MKIRFPETNYVVYDFETTGLDPQTSEVIQLSALKITRGEPQRFNAFVKIGNPLPEKIVELTKITNELLEKEGVSKYDAWSEFRGFISGNVLVGHNVICFDRLFLEKAFTDYGFIIPHKAFYIDTAMIYKALKLGEAPKYYEDHFRFCQRVGEIRAAGIKFNLVQCCKDLGIDISQFTAHRSDSDIEMTNLIYRRLLPEAAQAA
jgi:DNA polymerase III alpha subunit (gram-positive type)